MGEQLNACEDLSSYCSEVSKFLAQSSFFANEAWKLFMFDWNTIMENKWMTHLITSLELNKTRC